MTTYRVVEGWTSPIDMVLETDTGPYPITGFTVALELWKPDGSSVSLSGSLAITDDSGGIVRFSAATGDFKEGEYHGRVKTTDGSGKNAYWPNGEPDVWKVYKP